MTTPQRITLMADWWPKACHAQGWDVADRALRLKVLSDAVKRPLASASELNSTDDMDKVIAHLGELCSNVAKTIETDHPEMGKARRLRVAIGDYVKCLALYHPNAAGYLAEIIRDKFKHGSRAEPRTLDDLSAEGIPQWRSGERTVGPSELEQVMMKMAGAVQRHRKASGDTIHEMKLKAGVKCDCAICNPRRPAWTEIPEIPPMIPAKPENKMEEPF